jgi:hypothetical protein
VRLSSLLAAACVAATCACGGPGGEDAAQAPALKRHEVEESKFAVSVPSNWETLDDLDEEAIDEYSKENPDLAPFLKEVVEMEALRFLSFDPHIEKEFATNLNVLVGPIPQSMTWERWVAANVRGIRQIPSARIASESPIQLPAAGRAVRVVWTFESRHQGRSRSIHSDQYYLRNGRTVFVLTFSTLPELAAMYRETFARSARSFEFR